MIPLYVPSFIGDDDVQICMLEEQFGKQGEVRLDATAFVVSGIRPLAGVDVP